MMQPWSESNNLTQHITPHLIIAVYLLWRVNHLND